MSSSGVTGVDAHGDAVDATGRVVDLDARAGEGAVGRLRERVEQHGRATRVDERRCGPSRPRRAHPRRGPCARRDPAARKAVRHRRPGHRHFRPSAASTSSAYGDSYGGGASSVRPRISTRSVTQDRRSPRSAAASDPAVRRPHGRRRRAPDRPSASASSRAAIGRRRVRPCHRTRRRWRAGVPSVARPARTSSRRVRGRRARPSWWRARTPPSGAVGHRRAAARRRPSCGGPAPCRRGPGVEECFADDPVEPGRAHGLGGRTRWARDRDQRRRSGTRDRRRTRRRPCGTGAARRAVRDAAFELRPSRRRVQTPPRPRRLCVAVATPEARVSARKVVEGERRGLVDGLPAGAAAQVGGKGAVDVGLSRSGPSLRARRGAR